MARKAPRPAPKTTLSEAPDAARVERLLEVVDAVAQQIEDLREALDEIRSEVSGALGKNRLPPHVVHLTSMARDPLDPEFGAKLNRLTPADRTPDHLHGAPNEAENEGPGHGRIGQPPGQQRTLWE